MNVKKWIKGKLNLWKKEVGGQISQYDIEESVIIIKCISKTV